MKRSRLLGLLQERVFTLSVTIVALSAVWALMWPGKFPTFANLSTVFLNVSIDAIVAVGMMILLIGGAFDLSVGSVVAFSGGVAAHLMYYYGAHYLLAIAASMGAALLVGLTNGFLVAKGGINPMIQTLAMMGIVRGGALMASGAGIQNFPAAFNRIGQARLLGLQSPIWFMAVIVALFSVLVSKTVFFRRYYYIGGKGKVAYMGIVGMSNQEAGFRGLEDVLKQYPGIEMVGKFNDKCSMEEAARVTSDIISAHPDIAGIAGFTGTAGPGIAVAVKEAGKAGKIVITTVDWEPEHLKLLQEGVIHHLVGQKRELFSWYGAQFLFDMVHGAVRFTANDAKAGVAPVPHKVDTGLIEITPENVDLFL